MSSTPPVLSVMMPVYNEERTLEACVRAVLARPEVLEVVAVDDGSRDASWSILERVAAEDGRLRPLKQERNQGKGAALRRAISELRGEYAIVQDADLELDPGDYPNLVQPLLDGRAEVVYGARSFHVHDVNTLWFAFGNRLVTLVTNVLFLGRVQDMETCYKVLPTALWQSLGLRGDRFEIEPEITAKLLVLRKRIVNVPISYAARTSDEGKKLGWRDGLQAIGTLVKLRLQGRRALFAALPQGTPAAPAD